ncbi:hypothetical protein [Winogradskyella sp. MIT101101]|uniref:hypothetical protein n=1 Tax=Winogradskyella sp. MIT101101 TaxID=3098297 RepID=UPI003999BA96
MDLINYDFMPLISSLDTKPIQEQKVIIKEIKSEMVNILKHFIECTWGSHYNTVFKRLIKPYLDNPLVLDYVLKSEIIKDKNIVIGKTGAKAYPELLKYLMLVDSLKIRIYLSNEFELNDLYVKER